MGAQSLQPGLTAFMRMRRGRTGNTIQNTTSNTAGTREAVSIRLLIRWAHGTYPPPNEFLIGIRRRLGTGRPTFHKFPPRMIKPT